MYLNIVNNLSLGNKRNNNFSYLKKIEEDLEEEKTDTKILELNNEFFYNSIFFGQLTQNWIKLTN